MKNLNITLEVGDIYGTSNNSFCITKIDAKKDLYKAIWQGEFWKRTGAREQTSYWQPAVVFPISEFEALNKEYTEDGVMAYLPVKLESDYNKNQNF